MTTEAKMTTTQRAARDAGQTETKALTQSQQRALTEALVRRGWTAMGAHDLAGKTGAVTSFLAGVAWERKRKATKGRKK